MELRPFLRGSPHRYFAAAEVCACAVEHDDGVGSAPRHYDDQSQTLSQAANAQP